MSLRAEKVVSNKLKNFFHTILLMLNMAVLMGLLGFSIFGVSGLVWAAIFALLFLAVSPSISPQLVLRIYSAWPLSAHDAPHLYQIVQELAGRAHLPAVPRLYYVPTRVMNAFSVGSRNAAVIGVTAGLLDGLNLRELTGVLAHEISHIRNNDMRVMALADVISRFTGFFALLGQFLLFVNLPLVLVGELTIPWLLILLLLIGPILSDLLQLALARTREYDADLDAVRITGDPEGLAQALQKLEYQRRGLLGWIFLPGRNVPDPSIFRTHPSTEKRVERLLQLSQAEDAYIHPAAREFFVFPEHLSRVERHPRWRPGGLWF